MCNEILLADKQQQNGTIARERYLPAGGQFMQPDMPGLRVGDVMAVKPPPQWPVTAPTRSVPALWRTLGHYGSVLTMVTSDDKVPSGVTWRTVTVMLLYVPRDTAVGPCKYLSPVVL